MCSVRVWQLRRKVGGQALYKYFFTIFLPRSFSVLICFLLLKEPLLLFAKKWLCAIARLKIFPVLVILKRLEMLFFIEFANAH